MNVDRLRWINSRHVRTLFVNEAATDEHKMAVVNDVLVMISSVLEKAGLSSAPAHVVKKFGLHYIWRAMDLMKVHHNTMRCHSSRYLIVVYFACYVVIV